MLVWTGIQGKLKDPTPKKNVRGMKQWKAFYHLSKTSHLTVTTATTLTVPRPVFHKPQYSTVQEQSSYRIIFRAGKIFWTDLDIPYVVSWSHCGASPHCPGDRIIIFFHYSWICQEEVFISKLPVHWPVVDFSILLSDKKCSTVEESNQLYLLPNSQKAFIHEQEIKVIFL